MKSKLQRFLDWGFSGKSGGFASGPDFGPIGNVLLFLVCLAGAACFFAILVMAGATR